MKLNREIYRKDFLDGKKLKLSRYCYMLKRERIICMYHALSLGKAYLPIGEYEKLIGILKNNISMEAINDSDTEEILCNLYEKCMVIEYNEDEENILNYCRGALWEKIGIRLLYLILTERCNLNCSYCFVEKNFPSNANKQDMSVETAINAVSYFGEIRSNPSINSQIIFYGGEPLLNYKCMQACINKIGEMKQKGGLPKRQTVSLLTNGTLVSESIADYLYNHGVEVAVSIDGPESFHNNYRRYANGKGSFSDVLKGIEIFKKYYKENVGISLVINPGNIEVLPEMAEWAVREIGVKYIGLSLPTYPLNTSMNGKEVAKKIFESYKVLKKYNVVEERFSRVLEPFYKEMIYPSDCGAIGSQIVVAPNGDIGVCHAFLGDRKYFVKGIERIHKGKINVFSLPEWQEWSVRSPLLMKNCQKCIAQGICGGGCGYNALKNKGSIWDMDDKFCEYIKEMLELLLWYTYETMTESE